VTGASTHNLRVENLSIAYGTGERALHAVRDVSFSIAKGEAYGLIGESGSGKTSVAYALLKYLRGGTIRTGAIDIAGNDILAMSPSALRDFRGNRAAMVYQDPMSSLNPSIVVGEQIAEALRRHRGLDERAAWQRSVELLALVHLPAPDALAKRYPHQLSGGQQQRVVIALAIACEPDLLILDEPTTGLDVTTQAVVLDLIQELRHRVRSSILFISHNLGVVAQTCDRIGVLYAGELVEEGLCATVVSQPSHPYTAGLLRSMPRAADRAFELKPIPGSLPDLTRPPPGCIFAKRCEVAGAECTERRPGVRRLSDTHVTRCFFPERVPELRDAGDRAAAPAVAAAAGPGAQPVLEMDALSLSFRQRVGLPFFGTVRETRALDDVSLSVPRGRTLAVVGESGSGKSTLARTVVGLLAAEKGVVRFEGTALASQAAQRELDLRRRIQMIFQNPDGALNPQLRVGDIVARPLRLYGRAKAAEIPARVVELLEKVRLGARYASRFPHELSGGEKQRVNIARVLAADPEIIVCDEPTSALDISVQASVLNQLRELQAAAGLTYLFISHDLAVVRYISDTVAVMYLGRVVETGPTETIFHGPHHPYTESLLAALPEIDKPRRPVAAVPPLPDWSGKGCLFAPRCPRRIDGLCERVAPPLADTGDGRLMACHVPLSGLAAAQAAIPTVEPA
jgi:peptide/nickel transport system ATP-binding protein